MLPIKICCIQSIEEANLAIQAGSTALGLVSEMPSGWGPIPLERIGAIAAHIPPLVTSVLLTSRQSAREVIAQQQVARCNAIQIVDEFPIADYATLREQIPGVSILQAVHVFGPESIEKAKMIAPHVAGIILDTGSPHGETKVLGGTGKTHDWSISKAIVQEVSCPIFLAGGLNEENVTHGLELVQPFGLDLCTGVRTDNALDEKKLRSFLSVARQAHLAVA